MIGKIKDLIKLSLFHLRRRYFIVEYNYTTYREYIIHKLKGGTFESRLRNGICLRTLRDKISINKSKRLAIFVGFHNPNFIPESNKEYVKALINCSFDVLYLHNGLLEKQTIEELQNIGCYVICRENIGQDFGAWKDMILYLSKYNLLHRINWLLICNDSNFFTGGLNGEAFQERFKERLENQSDKDFISLLCNYQMLLHHQSYFICFSNNVTKSSRFLKYWKNYKVLGNRYHAIEKGEKELSISVLKYFRQSILYTSIDLYESVINFKENNKLDNFISNLPINAFYLEKCINESNSEKIAIIRAISMLEKYNQSHAFGLLLMKYCNYPFLKRDVILKGSFSMSQISGIISKNHIISNRLIAEEMSAYFLRVGLPYSYWHSPKEAHRKGIEPHGERYDAYPDSQTYMKKYMAKELG
ncbi:rhamnan synthesis F family protein [Prochlorococcus marinus]|uniref:Putative glycosyltransferase n=1 Tax=Prochlorococcus marinus str. PAC1 TaxID=59924 RepID=A0A0A2CAG4_PROMR|nr:rhamnan synthesis F family protein [Prochlorococcus marinus]KGG21890.1 putative glycosyltransferase [Prochlorococcus marinus str. PAC1]